MVGKVIDVIIPTPTGYTVEKVSETVIREDIQRFEDGFPDGVYVIPSDENEPKVKIRALHHYCEEKGVTPDKLSKMEMKRFLDL